MKKILKHKVYSGALQFTIFIGVIIALLLAGLMLLQNTHTFFIQQSKAAIENIRLANSGITFLKQQDHLLTDTTAIEKISDSNQKIEIQSSLWGIYEKGVVKASHRKKIFYKCALLGTQIDEIKRPNLFLQDNLKPLVVVGNTLLRGNIFLPGQGIEPGYISRESFYGSQLITGNSYKSDMKLPELKYSYKEKLEELLKPDDTNNENHLKENEKIKYRNSFLQPTKIWHSKNEIVLDDINLSGNIIVKSDLKITIKNTAILKDIILAAPIIIVQDAVSGNFQAIANKQIKIGKDCKLAYPSALIYIEKMNETPQNLNIEPLVFIDKNTEIRGSILYIKNNIGESFTTQVLLEENAVVKGEVYCEGNFEIKGKVIGSVFTEQFIVNKGGTVFVNYIYNGQIVNDNFPDEFCGVLLKNNKKGIAKWIY